MRLKVGESVKTLIHVPKKKIDNIYFLNVLFFLGIQIFKCEQCCVLVLLPPKGHTALQWVHFPLLLCSAWARGCWCRSVMRWQGQRPRTSCRVSSWVALQCILKIQWKSLQGVLLDTILVNPSAWLSFSQLLEARAVCDTCVFSVVRAQECSSATAKVNSVGKSGFADGFILEAVEGMIF